MPSSSPTSTKTSGTVLIEAVEKAGRRSRSSMTSLGSEVLVHEPYAHRAFAGSRRDGDALACGPSRYQQQSMSMTLDMDLRASPLPMLKALAEPLRWTIVAALAGEELCVCHLSEDLGVAQPLISHHLRVLRDAGLVESEKWRYWTYYRLRPSALAQLGTLIDTLATAGPAAAAQRRPCC